MTYSDRIEHIKIFKDNYNENPSGDNFKTYYSEVRKVVLDGSPDDLRELINSGCYNPAERFSDTFGIKRDFLDGTPSPEMVEKFQILLDSGMRVDDFVASKSNEFGSKSVFDALMDNGIQNQQHELFAYKKEMIEMCAKSAVPISLDNTFSTIIYDEDYRNSGVNLLTSLHDVELMKTFIENGYKYDDFFNNPDILIKEGLYYFTEEEKAKLKASSLAFEEKRIDNIMYGDKNDFIKALKESKTLSLDELQQIVLSNLDHKEEKLNALIDSEYISMNQFSGDKTLSGILIYGMSISDYDSDNYKMYKDLLIKGAYIGQFDASSLNGYVEDVNVRDLLLSTGDSELIKEIIVNTNVNYEDLFADKKDVLYSYSVEELAEYKILSMQKTADLSENEISEIKEDFIILHKESMPLFREKVEDFFNDRDDNVHNRFNSYVSTNKLLFDRECFKQQDIFSFEHALFNKFGADAIQDVAITSEGHMLYHISYENNDVQKTYLIELDKIDYIKEFDIDKVKALVFTFDGEDAIKVSSSISDCLAQKDSVIISTRDFLYSTQEGDLRLVSPSYDAKSIFEPEQASATDLAIIEDNSGSNYFNSLDSNELYFD